jgi:hypothetical protein
VNAIYVDGHSASALSSMLTWGQFYGIFDEGVTLPNGQKPNQSISKPAYDAVAWSTKPK